MTSPKGFHCTWITFPWNKKFICVSSAPVQRNKVADISCHAFPKSPLTGWWISVINELDILFIQFQSHYFPCQSIILVEVLITTWQSQAHSDWFNNINTGNREIQGKSLLNHLKTQYFQTDVTWNLSASSLVIRHSECSSFIYKWTEHVNLILIPIAAISDKTFHFVLSPTKGLTTEDGLFL